MTEPTTITRTTTVGPPVRHDDPPGWTITITHAWAPDDPRAPERQTIVLDVTHNDLVELGYYAVYRNDERAAIALQRRIAHEYRTLAPYVPMLFRTMSYNLTREDVPPEPTREEIERTIAAIHDEHTPAYDWPRSFMSGG